MKSSKENLEEFIVKLKWFFAAKITKLSTEGNFTPAFGKPMLGVVFFKFNFKLFIIQNSNKCFFALF